MKSSLLTIYARPSGEDCEYGLSIFLGDAIPTSDGLDADLASLLRRSPPLNFAHIVGYSGQIQLIKRQLLDPASVLLDRLRSALPQNRPILFFHFDQAVGEHCCTDLENTVQPGLDLINDERRFSLIQLFRASGGEEQAPKGTHYAKTSDSHAERFLRVSNVLEQGQHVSLLAFWLLPMIWKSNAQHLIVDTSNIYAVAYKMVQDAMRLGGIHQPITVWSHRSHHGVDEIPSHIITNALFLVSASTSNGLVRKLLSRSAVMAKVKTLFSLASDEIEGHRPLCDLRMISPAGAGIGIPAMENLPADTCRLCQQNFHLIKIQGDQFSIAPPRINAVEILSKDLDPALRPVLSALCGIRAFFAYRRRQDGRICSLGVDALPILNCTVPDKSRSVLNVLRQKWASALRRAQTISLRNIIKCAYPGSELLAEQALAATRPALANTTQVEVVASKDLRQCTPVAHTSTLVISACVDEAQELLSISRALRDVQDSGYISYLSVVQLIAPKEDAKRLKTNITFGQLGAGTFSYSSCLELPVDCYEEQLSWRDELDELRRLKAWLDKHEIDIPVAIEDRVQRLAEAPSSGMVDDLFWCSAQGQELSLRSDFTLADGTLEAPCASQADIFAIICVVLTSLRSSQDPNRRLAQNDYERNVLSPRNFDRFNDGVLQACLLRAARPKELAYGACNESISEDMLHILVDCLPNPVQPEKSEALLEFLVALITGRLTLIPKHLFIYIDKLHAVAPEGSIEKAFGSYLRWKNDHSQGV